MQRMVTFSLALIIFMAIGCDRKQPLTTKRLKEIANTYGQFAPEDAFAEDAEFAYYGSENEWTRRQFSEASADRLYKRRGQRQLLEILDGHPDLAVSLCSHRLKEDPNDPDYYYMLTLAYTKLGDIDAALASFHQAITLGIPPSRFMAGPRDLLSPLLQNPAVKAIMDDPDQMIVHGPMLGDVTPAGINIWLRTSQEADVKITCFTDQQLKKKVGEYSHTSTPSTDYTVVIRLHDLLPNTKYYYSIQVNDQVVHSGLSQSFMTRSSPRNPTQFSVAFGGGAGYTPPFERMWDTIRTHDPSALLLLGDNVYIDIPEMPGPFHDYTYYRRQSQPDFRRLVSEVPVYTIWDDHDAATDDVWLGPYVKKPIWKMPLLSVFKNNWNNPGYGSSKWPGCWYKFSIGQVDFFMLDGRTYRTNPFKEDKTMLGPEQKTWLLNALGNSIGTFKVIVSPVPWTDGAKPGSHDTWSGFPKEREEIFTFLAQNGIDGTILMSADRHRTDYWKVDRAGDYPLYEFTSSKLTNIHTHDVMAGAIFGYNDKCSFGKLTFDTTLDDPVIIFDIYSIDNEKVHADTIHLSSISGP